MANLGFIPPDAKFTTAEVKDLKKLHELRKQHPYLEKCRIISDSDAHYLEHMNEPVHELYVEERTREAVIKALKDSPTV